MSLRYCSGVFFLTRFLNSHIVFLSIWYAILISVFKIIQAYIVSKILMGVLSFEKANWPKYLQDQLKHGGQSRLSLNYDWKEIALINVLMNNLKHRQSLNNEFIRPTEEFGQPILIPKTDAVDCFFPACRGSLISNTGQGRKTTVTIAITTNQQRNSSQSKTANNTKTYVYIGVGAGALLVGTGGAISLIKWIHKKKSQQRVIDVDSS